MAKSCLAQISEGKSAIYLASEENAEENRKSLLIGPAIYARTCPGVPVAFFGGPWLPMSYTDEFVKYSFQIKYPLQILEQKGDRNSLVKGLLKLLPGDLERNLFASHEDTINSLFDRMLQLKNSGKRLYSQWNQKIGNKVRGLATPNSILGEFLKDYVKPILLKAKCHEKCHGGEKGWSPQKSLETHLPVGSVLSFDLKSAFDNVGHQYIFDFYYGSFRKQIPDKELRKNIAGFLTHVSSVCNHNEENDILAVLPQGSPISIALFNRILYPVDVLLDRKSGKKELNYSRWVDDIIISSPKPDTNIEKVIGAVAVVRKDFPIAMNKIFWQHNPGDIYLMGHKIANNKVVKIDKNAVINKGEPIEKSDFFTEMEWENAWIYRDEEDWEKEYPEVDL